MDEKATITAVITIGIAVLGYLAKYINDIVMANRKDKLERINRQLKEFYGPLLSLVSSSDVSWIKFRGTYRKDIRSYFDDSNPPSEEEKEIWRNWMQTVFNPINERIYEVIIKNGDLIIEDKFPDCFRELCAHVETYRPVMKKWEANDYTEHVALLNYPVNLKKHVEERYAELKATQNKLINKFLI